MAFTVNQGAKIYWDEVGEGRPSLAHHWVWGIRLAHGTAPGQFYLRNTGQLLWTTVVSAGAICRQAPIQLP